MVNILLHVDNYSNHNYYSIFIFFALTILLCQVAQAEGNVEHAERTHLFSLKEFQKDWNRARQLGTVSSCRERRRK